MQELINELNKANYAYYNSDSPIMSDEEYDLKLKELQKLEEETGIIMSNSPTQKVGAPVLSELKKVPITPKPMLSLDKCHSNEEVVAFAGKKEMVAMIKLDGLSVRIKYNNGKLISANTRGNGIEGTDITEHIKQFQNVPLKIEYQYELILDGEAIIKIPDFKEINKNNEFKNPRNAAAGALNVLDTQLVKDRKLSFVVWDVISELFPLSKENEFRFLTDKFREVECYGFEIVPYYWHSAEPDIKSVQIVHDLLMEKAKNKYPCDGIVWKFEDIEYGNSLGQTSHHFKNGIAWKPEIEVVESELIDIDWTMGRSGVLTPVAVFEPVELDGSVIERASLHNYSIMKKILGRYPHKKEKLKIFKANMIIPQILEADPTFDLEEAMMLKLNIDDMPTVCPCCGHMVERQTSDAGIENIVCSNPNCAGKLINKLDHFCGKKGLDIKGLSKATLEKLITWEWVSCFADIYELERYKIIWMDTVGFGDKSVRAILTAIEESKNTTLEKFISAIGIPLIGNNVAKEICKHVSTYEEFRKLVDEKFDFSEWDTFGPEKSSELLKFDYSEADKVAKLLNITNVEQKSIPMILNFTVCITGKLESYKNRTLLQKDIELRGGHVTNSISSKTKYLINNDINSNSTKNIQAKKLGIPIITEKEFIEKYLY